MKKKVWTSDELVALPRTRAEALASSSKFYFTGRPCKRGHVVSRRASSKSCAACQAMTQAIWQKANPERAAAAAAKWRAMNPGHSAEWCAVNPGYARAWNLKRKYGLTLADYEVLLGEQNGCCAIVSCHAPAKLERDGVLCVDHDHVTGQVRGLLCHACNTRLHTTSTPAQLRELADYLEFHNAMRVKL